MKITQLFLLQASDFVLCSQDAFSHTIWYFLREGGLILLKCSPATMTLCYQDFSFSLNREEKKRLRTPRRSLLQIPTQQLFTIKWLCLQNGEGTFGSDYERDDSRIEIRCQDVGRLLSGVWQPKVRLWGCRDQSFEN